MTVSSTCTTFTNPFSDCACYWTWKALLSLFSLVCEVAQAHLLADTSMLRWLPHFMMKYRSWPAPRCWGLVKGELVLLPCRQLPLLGLDWLDPPLCTNSAVADIHVVVA